ncbi:hypothetical protein [Formosa haliotis]|uniref:hypothetical protein n=1 Tax=Formosa haliotis TaxID=1555194 RepID=UPI000825A989|nr:hypothetical protein [Formosa haliotis]
MSPKKILKISAGVIIFFTLPSLLFFGYVYFKYNEDLPQGTPSKAADEVAQRMLDAIDYEAYKNTNYIEWTFNKRHHFKWKKNENYCEVYWKNIRVDLQLNAPKSSVVTVGDNTVTGEAATEYIDKAVNYFNNDSFWLVAPYKVFDSGTTRSLIPIENNAYGLLVTYTSGGSTPGDSYMWLLQDDAKPKAFKMWTSILPIDGLEASWSDWKTTETKAQLPTFHKLFFMGLEITDLKTDY